MLVQCTYGPTVTEVGGTTYSFIPDEFGRAVATVHDERHVQLLTSVVHYRVVLKDPDELTLTSLDPATAELGGEDFVLRCLGAGFGPDSVIFFAGQPEPIVFVSTEEITTIVKPSLGWGAVTLPVYVRRYDLAVTDPLDFTFTEPVVVEEDLPDEDPDETEGYDAGDDGEDVGKIPLTEINGIGKGTAAKLEAMGIDDARQIAKWSAKKAKAIDDELGLNGRVERDNWVGQAKALAG
jgi:hypothetical protein